MDIPIIFLSHTWADKETAEKIFNTLTQVGIKVKMDNHELKYKDNIVSFMESIRECDFAILLISDKYLKSKNCLYEVLNLLKEKSYTEKLLPVILDTAKIYETKDKIEYLKFWTNQQIELATLLKTLDPINASESYNDLKIITNITQSIDAFLAEISRMLNITFKALEKSGYRELLDKIGFQDISDIVDLLRISLIQSIAEKEIELDKYLTKHKPNTFYFGIKASTYLSEGKVQQAKFNYQESIRLFPDNTTSLNNLGNLCNTILKEYDLARECFEKAIKVDPQHSIARLNLGVLLSDHFKDFEGSKRQYEAILAYDDNEFKAHNNIANYYKRLGGESDKIIYHLKKAIEINPKYLEAHINLANYLKVNGKFEEGNNYYQMALAITGDKAMIGFINTLLKSTKG
jgi:tetratricopeptide (TPR) repeat protein